MRFLVADQGAVGLDDDGVGGAVVDYFTLLAPGVQLYGQHRVHIHVVVSKRGFEVLK
jgi:hypothetical protein